jgi:hypothetical protein
MFMFEFEKRKRAEVRHDAGGFFFRPGAGTEEDFEGDDFAGADVAGTVGDGDVGTADLGDEDVIAEDFIALGGSGRSTGRVDRLGPVGFDRSWEDDIFAGRSFLRGRFFFRDRFQFRGFRCGCIFYCLRRRLFSRSLKERFSFIRRDAVHEFGGICAGFFDRLWGGFGFIDPGSDIRGVVRGGSRLDGFFYGRGLFVGGLLGEGFRNGGEFEGRKESAAVEGSVAEGAFDDHGVLSNVGFEFCATAGAFEGVRHGLPFGQTPAQ